MTPSVLPTGGSALTHDQLQSLRGMLHQQRNFRLEQLQQLRRSGARGPLADVEREISDSLAAGARAALRDVLIALRRMDEGVYGRCRDCGTGLAFERLEILPQVTRCLPCGRAADPA